jgi:membrane dipeptidase
MPGLAQPARTIHNDAILIDGHNDQLYAAEYYGTPYDLTRVSRGTNTDAPRLIRAGVAATFFMTGGFHLDRSLVMMERARQQIEQRPDLLLHVTKTAHIRAAKRAGKLAILLSWESCDALMGRLEILHAIYRLGVRVCTVTYNDGGGEFSTQGSRTPTRYCSPQQRDASRRRAKGLTSFGREVIREMNRLGILVDVSHSNDATLEDVVSLSGKPVAATHGAVFALCPHTRCSTDEQIRAIAATGGLFGVTFWSSFVAKPPVRPTINRVVDHIAYASELVGTDHVAIGSDWGMAFEPHQVAIRRPADLVTLTQAMLRRGFTEQDVRKIWGENYLRVLSATIG